MKDTEWIDAKSACAALGVKPQTLYAYVSRHQIRAKTDPGDARRSLYAKSDIDTLLRQNRRPRARADVAQGAIRWGDPVMLTSISEVRDATIWLRGRHIEDCARHMTLEQVAALLCGVQTVTCPATSAHVTGRSAFTRAIKMLAGQVDTAAPMQDQDPTEVALNAGRMISLIADACLGQALSGPIHERIGSIWALEANAQDVIRRSLVLLSDHELNPSTFAVRVCASTGASLPAALLAGMATLSGPRHGGVATLSNAALRAVLDDRLEQFLHRNAHRTPYAYGFGHPLYPEGDPRAAHLLRQIPKEAPARKAVEKLAGHLEIAPNIDAALAVIVAHFGCPPDAAATIFSIGRTAGWIAHATEQYQSRAMIRPRARYHALSSRK